MIQGLTFILDYRCNLEDQVMKNLAWTIALTCVAGAAMAENLVGITKDMPSVSVPTADGMVEIDRIQETS